MTLFDHLDQHLVILPDNVTYQCYFIAMQLVTVLSSLYYAYCTAFRFDLEGGDFGEYWAGSHELHGVKFTQEEIKTMNRIELVVEVLYSLQILVTFVTAYRPPNGIRYERRLRKIAEHYLKGRFVIDLITVVPLPHLLQVPWAPFLYLPKWLRLSYVVQGLQGPSFAASLKHIHLRRLERLCKDPHLATDTSVDRTKITELIMLKLAIQAVRLTTLILFFSYYVGILFIMAF